MTGADLLLDTTFTLADLPRLRSLTGDCAIVAGLCGRRRDEFVLAAHELLANAIEHGGGRGQVQVQVLRAAGELRCQVRDRGPGISPGAGDGGGLHIVRALADRLDILASGAGTAVTIAITLSRAGRPF